jgi:hypothetical protein
MSSFSSHTQLSEAPELSFLTVATAQFPLDDARDFEEGNVDTAFGSWVGQSVVLQLALGETKLSARGMLLKNRAEHLLVQLESGPEIEIPKAWVLAIEEGRCSNICHHLAVQQGLS